MASPSRRALRFVPVGLGLGLPLVAAVVACSGNELELMKRLPSAPLARVTAVAVGTPSDNARRAPSALTPDGPDSVLVPEREPLSERVARRVATMGADSAFAPQGVAGEPRASDEPMPPLAEGAAELPPGDGGESMDSPVLVAIAREAIVYAEPSRSAPKLGYLRLGARVQRAPEPAGRDGCPGGWFRIAPAGYVCTGNAASLDAQHPLAALAQRRPDRDAALPYLYGRAKPVPPPLYTHLPTRTETTALEGSVPRRAAGWEDVTASPASTLLAHGGELPSPLGFARPEAGTVRAVQNSGFALLDVLEHAGRRFGLTTDLELVPLDRLTRVVPSAFHGVVLDENVGFPLVFVRARRAVLYSGSPEHGLRVGRLLGYREAVALSGKSARIGPVRFLETRAHEWLADTDLVHVPEAPVPALVHGERTWIHVSIATQTLVAYVGSRPVYATLVSTGADGLGDPETTHSTPRGEFLIHTKHVSVSMNGDEVGDEFDLRDVPYVEYFTQGFAFHAAYWHDAFGTPHSHGCVNLAPLDARWLFHFTEPAVPRGWHGAFSRSGTFVSITP